MEIIRENRWIRWLRRCFKFVVIMFSLLLLLASLVILSLLYLRSQPLPPTQIEETTTIYAHDGQVIDHIHHGQNRTYIPIEDIPPELLHAFIAIEDRHFYDHYGFDFKRIGGAVITNLRQRSLAEGASTITQQLARNLYLTHDKTWERKWFEAIYTVQLEMHFSKDDILEQYLNQIYFGHAAYGVQAAANIFFGKDVRELSLAESALLAGIPKGPRYYSPWNSSERAKERQQIILNEMYKQGYISASERDQALAEEVEVLDEGEQMEVSQAAPYFEDYIYEQLTQKYDLDQELLQQGGLHIHTTLDTAMQQTAEETLEHVLPEDRPLQGALLAVDPRTGHIKAMVGGRDYEESSFNRVFANRHAGSALKPFLYYRALEQGFTPLTLMKSEPMTFTYDEGRSEYTPSNFNDQYAHDEITLETAIAASDNIYAVKTLMHLGEEELVDTLARFGFPQEFQPLPSLALGAQDVTLFHMVKGYSILANEGEKTEPTAITTVKDREGNILVDQNEVTTEQVLEKSETFILNRMLRNVFEPGGTANRVASELNRPVSGKTGSTDTDSWMMGFTPQLVSGVWVGYDQNQMINHNNDGRKASYIWARFMEKALAGQPPAMYDIPEDVTGAYVDPESGKLATEHCPVKRLLYFKEGTEPTEYCPHHLPEEEAKPVPLEKEEPSSVWEKLKEWWDERE